MSLRPDVDTPKALNEYAKMHHVKPGWTFLTGRPADIEVIRRKLGFVDLDPVADKDKKSHIGLLRIGNELTDMWIATPGISKPKNVIKRILWLETPADFQPENGSTQKARPASAKKK
jgi:protein SCO1/2